MSSRRAAAANLPAQHLTKAEACRILQVAPNADEELITKAYWHQARKFRAFATSDPAARAKLDELNRAYVLLNPGRGEPPLAKEYPPVPQAPSGFYEQISVFWRQLIEHTRAVWPEHLAEVSVLSATTAILTYLALTSGASLFVTALAAGVAALAIWSPWRRA